MNHRVLLLTIVLIAISTASCECEESLKSLDSVLVPNPTEILFDDTYVGGLDKESIQFTNVGSIPLFIEKIAVASRNGDSFDVDAFPEGAELPSGKSFKFEVRFLPKSEGELKSTLILESKAGKLEVPLQGNALAHPDCDQSNLCISESFDPLLGECVATNLSGNDCTGENQCVLSATCLDGECLVLETRDCTDTAINFCDRGVCQPATGECIIEEDPSACYDDETCTQDRCDREAQACEWMALPDDIHCGIQDGCASLPTCQSGVCTDLPPEDGSVCTDQNICTIEDQCLVGSCTGTPAPENPQQLGMLRGFGYGKARSVAVEGSQHVMGDRILIADPTATGIYFTLAQVTDTGLDILHGPARAFGVEEFTIGVINANVFLVLTELQTKVYEVDDAGAILERSFFAIPNRVDPSFTTIGTHGYFCGLAPKELFIIDVTDLDSPQTNMVNTVIDCDVIFSNGADEIGVAQENTAGVLVSAKLRALPNANYPNFAGTSSTVSLSDMRWGGDRWWVRSAGGNGKISPVTGPDFATDELIEIAADRFRMDGNRMMTGDIGSQSLRLWDVSGAGAPTLLKTFDEPIDVENFDFTDSIVLSPGVWAKGGSHGFYIFRLQEEPTISLSAIRHPALGLSLKLSHVHGRLFAYANTSLREIDISDPYEIDFSAGGQNHHSFRPTYWAFGGPAIFPIEVWEDETLAAESFVDGRVQIVDGTQPDLAHLTKTAAFSELTNEFGLQGLGASISENYFYGIYADYTTDDETVGRLGIWDLRELRNTPTNEVWLDAIREFPLPVIGGGEINEIILSPDRSMAVLLMAQHQQSLLAVVMVFDPEMNEVIQFHTQLEIPYENDADFVNGSLVGGQLILEAGGIIRLYQVSAVDQTITQTDAIHGMEELSPRLLGFLDTTAVVGTDIPNLRFYDTASGIFIGTGNFPTQDSLTSVAITDHAIYGLSAAGVEVISPPCQTSLDDD